MCDKQRPTSQTSSSSRYNRATNHDMDLYALWRKHLESDEHRKFKVRCKFPIGEGMELISGNLMMAYSNSAPSSPISLRPSTPTTTSPTVFKTPTKAQQEIVSEVFETPHQADIAILDTPKKKRALLKKNLSKLLQKFQRINMRQEDVSFGPTYHKYQYNCSLYDHLDKLNTTNGSQIYKNCIQAM